jgi:hypothetical protein
MRFWGKKVIDAVHKRQDIRYFTLVNMGISLSILVATMPSRIRHLQRVRDMLKPQLSREVEVLESDMPIPVGGKRQRLLEAASGAYLAFVDDDDAVAPDYVARILKAIESLPDDVGIWVRRYEEGIYQGLAIYSLGFNDFFHTFWDGMDRLYCRFPMHLSPVKRELALKAGFKNLSKREDMDYARRLLPLLKTEVMIEAPIYDYYRREFLPGY